MIARWEGVGRMGERDEGINEYKLVVTERSWGYKGQHREYSQ